MKKSVTFLATLVLAAGAHAGCYTVLGPKGQVLQESSTPPVNMAYQLHQTVPMRTDRAPPWSLAAPIRTAARRWTRTTT